MTRTHALLRAFLCSSLLVAALCACSGSGAPPDDGDPTTPPPASTWSKSFGGPSDDWANAVIATRDGGYLLAGVLNHQQVAGAGAVGAKTVDGDFWVTKLDTLGDPVWQQVLGERRSASGEGVTSYRRVRAAASGYWMVGTQTVAGPSGIVTNRDARVDLLVARLDDSGVVSWSRTYDSGTFGNDSFYEPDASAQEQGWDIAPLSDGGALAVAWSSAILRINPERGLPAAAPWVVRLSSTGEVLWQRRLSETQFQYLADEPADLLIRESAGNGALVAASARLRGTDPDPAAQVTLLDGGGVVQWSQRYSRLLVRDLLQAVEEDDGLPNDDIVIAGEDFGWRELGAGSLDDPDTIVMKLEVEDGTEDWREELDEGVTVNAISQQCRRRPDDTLLCYYLIVGSGKIDDEGVELAMAVRIAANGLLVSKVFLPGFAAATDVDVQPGVPLTPDTPVVIVGHALHDSANGARGFRATFTPTLNETGREFTPWSRTASGRFFDAVILQRDAQVLASVSGSQGLSLRTFAMDGAPLLSREFGGVSERRGERAFDAIEVSDGFIVAGQSDGTGADPDHPATMLAKLRENGSVAWQSSLSDFSMFAPGQLPVEALADGGEGGMVVVGAQGVSASGWNLIRVARLDGSGAVSWVSVPVNPGTILGTAYASSVQRASDGGYFVAGGVVVDDQYDSSAWLTALDAQGALRWQRFMVDGLRITSVRALPDGGAVLAGVSMHDGARKPWAASVGADGTLRWKQIYEAQSADSDPLARITLAAGGGYLLATSYLVTAAFDQPSVQAAAGRRNALLIRLNADGSARWHRTYGGLQDETIYGLDSTADGGFVVAGRSDSLGERGEAWVMRLGADGKVNAGCNALISESPGTHYAPLPPAWHGFSGTGFPAEMVVGGSIAQSSQFPGRAPTDVVVARQCSGVAQPDGGVTPSGFRLTVVQGSASAPGVVTSMPVGITCGTTSNICEARYAPNTTVTLRVDPGMAGRFIGWAGCDVVDGDRCLVNMTADRSVTATFRAANSPTLQLGVSGNGQVSGGGLGCRAGAGVCTAIYSPGEIVVLTATPDATETFLGWGGDCAASARNTPINVEMSANRSCTAQFTGAAGDAPRVTVSLDPAQIGPVVGYVRSVPEGVTCGSTGTDCSQTFARGTAVRLEAVSTDASWEFETFRCNGGIQESGARSVSFDAERDVSCIATFAPNVERLRVKIVTDLRASLQPPGRVVSQGTTTPRHLDCTDDCDRPFTRDTTVTLRADANPAYVFSNWSGCDSLSPDPSGALPQLCHVLMSRTRNVHAAFTGEHIGSGDFLHVLSIDFPFDSGDGSVEFNRPQGLPPCTPQGGACMSAYDQTSGLTDEVVLTIRPAGNNSLVLNEGCAVFTPASGADPATCRVTMDRDRGVTFGFGTVNAAPVAVITRTPAGSVAIDETIQFSGAASTDDEDISLLSFQWDFDGDSITDATGMNVSRAFAESGTYLVRLMVVDRVGSVDIVYAEVEVIAANTPPAAFFIFSPGTPLVGAPVSFDASASTDSNGIASYLWDFDGDGRDDVIGDETTARVVNYTFNAVGTFNVRLRVVDNLGAVGETTRAVPVALASGGVTLTLNLQGGGSGVVTYVPIVTACSKDSEPICVRQFPQGTQVVMRASAYSGSSLGDWIGCTSLNATGTECTVDLSANRAVTLFIN